MNFPLPLCAVVCIYNSCIPDYNELTTRLFQVIIIAITVEITLNTTPKTHCVPCMVASWCVYILNWGTYNNSSKPYTLLSGKLPDEHVIKISVFVFKKQLT